MIGAPRPAAECLSALRRRPAGPDSRWADGPRWSESGAGRSRKNEPRRHYCFIFMFIRKRRAAPRAGPVVLMDRPIRGRRRRIRRKCGESEIPSAAERLAVVAGRRRAGGGVVDRRDGRRDARPWDDRTGGRSVPSEPGRRRPPGSRVRAHRDQVRQAGSRYGAGHIALPLSVKASAGYSITFPMDFVVCATSSKTGMLSTPTP